MNAAASAPVLPERAHHRFWPKRLPHSILRPQTSLWANLKVSPRRYPHKTALVFFDQTVAFADLKGQAERVAAHLQTQGVQAGDRVILLMQN